jgi:hypothetical protein
VIAPATLEIMRGARRCRAPWLFALAVASASSVQSLAAPGDMDNHVPRYEAIAPVMRQAASPSATVLQNSKPKRGASRVRRHR